MRPETKQLLKNISIGLGVFVLIGLVLYGVWHGTRAKGVTISEVSVVGGETISHERIKKLVETQLDGEYLGFIPRRFTWMYPQEDILDVLTKTPRVKDPTIKRTSEKLTVTLAEFEPVALWCGDSDASDCVFLDENGYGFAAAPDLSGGSYVRYIKIGQPASTSQVFTDACDFGLLRGLVSLLHQAGWPTALVELDQARDVFVYLVDGGELKVSLNLTPEQTVDNLQTIRAAEQYVDLAPGNFSYIDLRFGNKVFVSLEGDPADTESVVDSEIKTTTSSEAAVE